jgi:hypothetical protein
MTYGWEISWGTSCRLCQIKRWIIQDALNTLRLENFRICPTCLVFLHKLHVTYKSSILVALLLYLQHFQELLLYYYFVMSINNAQKTKHWNTAVKRLHQHFFVSYPMKYSFKLLTDCIKHCSIYRLDTRWQTRLREPEQCCEMSLWEHCKCCDFHTEIAAGLLVTDCYWWMDRGRIKKNYYSDKHIFCY